MKNQLDLTQDSVYDIVINANRTLDVTIDAYYLSGTTEVPFSFDNYLSATLQVRKTSTTSPVLTFSTTDGSIVLMNGQFRLNKAHTDLNVREGEYYYDMVLHSVESPNRAFLSGKFIIEKIITQ